MAHTLAFYGAGRRAQPYLSVLAARPDVTVVAVCDLDRRAAEQTAAGWGARVFLDGVTMLREAKPDALWVCIDSGWLGDVLAHAVEARIPFFIDGPSLGPHEASRELSRRAAACGLVTAVGFPCRSTDLVREAREYLGTNPIPLALGWWLCPRESVKGEDEVRLPASEVVALVDAMRFFCGEVRQVRALSPANTSAGDAWTCHLEFESGTVGVLTCATFPRPEPRAELELLGPGWALTFREDLTRLQVAERDKTTLLRSLNSRIADQSAEFLAAVSTQKPESAGVSLSEALQTLAICDAIDFSAKDNRCVNLKEQLEPKEKSVLVQS